MGTIGRCWQRGHKTFFSDSFFICHSLSWTFLLYLILTYLSPFSSSLTKSPLIIFQVFHPALSHIYLCRWKKLREIESSNCVFHFACTYYWVNEYGICSSWCTWILNDWRFARRNETGSFISIQRKKKKSFQIIIHHKRKKEEREAERIWNRLREI